MAQTGGAKAWNRQRDLVICTTYGLKRLPGTSTNASNGRTSSPRTPQSFGHLPALGVSPSSTKSFSASLSWNCLTSPPRRETDVSPVTQRHREIENVTPPNLDDSLSETLLPALALSETPEVPTMKSGLMEQLSRLPPLMKELNVSGRRALKESASLPALQSQTSQPEKQQPQHTDLAHSRKNQARHPSHRKYKSPKFNASNKGQTHGPKHTNRSQAINPDPRAVAAALRAERSKLIRHQMLIENVEYMDDQVSELRRGKVRLRNRVNECSDDELFENRSFYTDYAMTIRQRSQRKNQERRATVAAKILSDKVPLGSSISTLRPNTLTLPLPSSPYRPVSEDQWRRKKRGETFFSSSSTLELRALQQQIEGSHKNWQEHS